MEPQKPIEEKNAYTGRFGDRPSPKQSSTSAASARQPAEEKTRRPSGFAAAPQAPRKAAASVQPTEKATPKKQKSVPSKPKRTRRMKSTPRKRRIKPILALVVIAGIIYLLIVLLFGGSSKTVHQLPIVERESVASFDPETSNPEFMEAS